ncbi:hypothetical protein QYH69_05800 [Paraburkholderia sp. SARCC-3016]|jgi:hypothetical protein|uniref:hypothetical protein n=1 Tax=Paraburkholderia sp. SARCC-3016 TaxID=3058611 RepID=UPI002809834F|nr:hypothetical protein [Paraburkholderia sp. SARCC-3016]MDQ7976756.1 hypothetical protein [Paraburkholderia sp. SARCC-3016]
MTTLIDTAGAFAAAFGAHGGIGGMGWIVRPDGYIGWRSAQVSADAIDAWLRHAQIV